MVYTFPLFGKRPVPLGGDILRVDDNQPINSLNIQSQQNKQADVKGKVESEGLYQKWDAVFFTPTSYAPQKLLGSNKKVFKICVKTLQILWDIQTPKTRIIGYRHS